jgi:hypothetical protein
MNNEMNFVVEKNRPKTMITLWKHDLKALVYKRIEWKITDPSVIPLLQSRITLF